MSALTGRPTAIRFDLDETPVDSRSAIVDGLNARLRELGEPEPTLAATQGSLSSLARR